MLVHSKFGNPSTVSLYETPSRQQHAGNRPPQLGSCKLVEQMLAPYSVKNYLSTEELAVLVRVKPDSIRSGLCRHGHYLGITPVKLPNRRLAWSAEAVQILLAGEVM